MFLQLRITNVLGYLIYCLVTTTCAGSIVCLIWKFLGHKIDTLFLTKYTMFLMKSSFCFYLIPLMPILQFVPLLWNEDLRFRESMMLQSSPVNGYLYYIVGIIWIGGVVFQLVEYLRSHLMFKYHIANLSSELKNDACHTCMETLCKDLKIKRRLSVYISSDILDPCIFGVFRPKIYLPEDFYTEDNLMVILRHELMHYKHKDQLFKFFCIIAHCLHWFNPLIFSFMKKQNIWMEYHCDESCCYHYQNPCGGQHYFNTILTFSMSRKRKFYYVATESSENGNQLLERIEHMKIRKNRRPFKKSFLALGIGAFLLTGATTALATGNQFSTAYDALYNTTAVEIDETDTVSTQSTITTELIDDNPDAITEVLMPAGVLTRAATGSYTWTIPAKTRYITPIFTCTTNNTVLTFCDITSHSGKSARMGLKEPDGVYRYVTFTDSNSHTFNIRKVWDHQFYVENTNNFSITVSTYYAVK